ncbi:NAD(+) diphosphatase [Actibacterium sp. 188UL27-1]|uniref:NAD(+) diphosphatase n=1 Tax=Actibacterium sp. 188UL27-1 TaxID=2786961 RepID=UPI00195C7C82|nr:NAD(+) diphosphatase [Actibacterium sp. 188UL27-1]MBM7069493.1 NAD(+) diphosphatase [Actibacterium sp. 188UL27-1]
MDGAALITFGGSNLDRAAELRGNARALASLLTEPQTRILPLWRGKPLIAGDGDQMQLATVAPGSPVLEHQAEPPIFLGRSGAVPWFAVDVSGYEPEDIDTAALNQFLDPSEQRHPALPNDHRFAELRAIMTRLDARGAELAATAKAVTGWHATHRFCSRCGHLSEPGQAGWQRDCPNCGSKHFPRTDPVVIMLITRGNKVLVGRSPGWPDGMYSLLAGFVEPGETIEAAVRREVFEEVGISVGAVGYLASQPWPFPASLMIGCHGVALDEDMTIDPVEIETASWVSREDMADVFLGRSDRMKPARKGAIAHALLSDWLAGVW